MKKTVPKILFLFILFVISISFVSCQKDNGQEGEQNQKNENYEIVYGSSGIEYTLSDDGTYYIATGFGSCRDSDVVVGNHYNGKAVKSVGALFSPYNSPDFPVYSIAFSEGIERLEAYSIRSAGLTKITIPNSVEYIDEYAFALERTAILEVIKRLSFNKYEGGLYLGNEENPYVVFFWCRGRGIFNF